MAQPAVTTPSPPPVKAENDPIPPPSQPQTTTRIKQETQHLNTTTTNSPSSQQLQSQLSQIPPFINSITQLRNLSAALSTFQRCYDDLQTHLISVQSAIDSQLPPQKSNLSSQPHGNLPIIPLPQPISSPSQEKEIENPKPIRSELEGLCIMMSSRVLRKYMVANIGEPNKLREELPKALKLSPNPAKLVLECFGRFFLQGSKAYVKNSPMIHGREASVLVLECFLLMGNEGGNDGLVNIEKAIKEEAEVAAISWRKRLISEGGLAKASEIDARGLLFFLGCFGIPGVFRIEDFRDLVRAGNVKDISGVLRRSSVLMAKFSDIIGWMVKNKMAVDAIDIVYTFGFEDKFDPQTILTSFLQESKESSRIKSTSQGSLTALNEAKKKQLAALRSVVKCLEGHGIDYSKLLPECQINEKIKSLENDIADSDKNTREKTVQKRKADETESSKLKNQEKRLRYTGQRPQHQRATVNIDSDVMLDGIYGHSQRSFASSSVFHGAGARLLHESIAGSVSGTGDGVLGAGVSGGIISSSAAGVLRTGSSYAGVHSAALVDTDRQIVHHDGQPYGLHGNAALSERLVAHTFAGQPSSYGLTSLYRSTPSLEGFPGLLSGSTVGVPHRGSASDLYQFVDSIVQSESYHNSSSRTATAVSPVVPTRNLSYLY